MSGSALPELQAAVRTTLADDPTLAALVTGVFDQAPADQPHPFVVIGEKTETPYDTLSRRGVRATLGLEVRSRAVGDAEALAAYDRIKEVLDAAAPVLPSFAVVSGRTSLVRTAVEADGVTRRAEARYEVIAQAV